jgi:hypothetical protein
MPPSTSAIDFIWISSSVLIVDRKESLTDEKNLTIYRYLESSNYRLEY